MGAKFSHSRNGYNKILAQQPRDSNNLPNFFPPNHVQQPPLNSLPSIPAPVRYSPVAEQPKSDPPMNSNLSVDQSKTFKPVEISTVPPTLIDRNRTESIPQRTNMERSSSFSNRSQQSGTVSSGRDDVIVLSRSVINLSDHRSSRNQPSNSTRSIIERNGKKFSMEFLERTEQRYVQYFDPRQGRTRVFEVTDFIPTKIIQPIKYSSQLQLTDGLSANVGSSAFQSNPTNAMLPPRIPDGRRTSRSSELNSLRKNEEKSSQNTGSSTAPPATRLNVPSHQPIEAPAQYPSNTALNKTSHNQNGKSKEHPPKPVKPLRPMTPAESEYTAASSGIDASETEEDVRTTKNKVQPNRLSQVTSLTNRYNQMYRSSDSSRRQNESSLIPTESYDKSNHIDPFDRAANTAIHTYPPRIAQNTYAQPTTVQGVFSRASGQDYAPIPDRMPPSNPSQYSRMSTTNTYG